MKNNHLYKVLFSQGVSFITSFFLAFILPKIIGINQYGYWQIYLFYTSYVGIFQFGLNDGIYLKYGGLNYRDLSSPLFSIFYRILIYSQSIISIICITLVIVLERDSLKLYSLIFASANILILGSNAFFVIINQTTNRLGLFSRIILLEKIYSIIIVFVLYIVDQLTFYNLILLDFIGKIIILIINMYYCRSLINQRGVRIQSLIEIKNIINPGIKLTLANIISISFLGIGRIFVERGTDIHNFSLYSFAISASSIFIFFMNSVSIVLFPLLKKKDMESLSITFTLFNNLFLYSLIIVLIFYYIVEFMIMKYFVGFENVLDYLFILFPLTLFQGKIQLFLNSYYKALREEKVMLFANIQSLIVLLLGIISVVVVFGISIKPIVFVTFITVGFRCYASETFLKRKMKILNNRNIQIELIIISSFILQFIVQQYFLKIVFLSICLFYLYKDRIIINNSVSKLICGLKKI